MGIWKTFRCRKQCNPKDKAHRILKASAHCLNEDWLPKANPSASEASVSITHGGAASSNITCAKAKRSSKRKLSTKHRQNQSCSSIVPPGGGTLRRSRRNAGRPLPTPRRLRRSPLHRSATLLLGRVSLCDSALATLHSNAPKGRLHAVTLTVSAASPGGLSWKNCCADVSLSGIRASCT